MSKPEPIPGARLRKLAPLLYEVIVGRGWAYAIAAPSGRILEHNEAMARFVANTRGEHPGLEVPSGDRGIELSSHDIGGRLTLHLLFDLRNTPAKFGLRAPSTPVVDVTPQLRMVAGLLANSAMSYREIAGALGKSPGTIHKQVSALYRKFDVDSRQAFVLAWRQRASLR